MQSCSISPLSDIGVFGTAVPYRQVAVPRPPNLGRLRPGAVGPTCKTRQTAPQRFSVCQRPSTPEGAPAYFSCEERRDSTIISKMTTERQWHTKIGQILSYKFEFLVEPDPPHPTHPQKQNSQQRGRRRSRSQETRQLLKLISRGEFFFFFRNAFRVHAQKPKRNSCSKSSLSQWGVLSYNLQSFVLLLI